MYRTRRTIAERFWTKANVRGDEDCWPWTACMDSAGYGRFTVSAAMRGIPSQRVAFYLTHGRWPRPCCLHTCDNPACVNPRHLVEGTQAENVADMVGKGRHRVRTKVSERDVQIIRLLVGRIGVSQKEIAERYGMSEDGVSCIVLRKSWPRVQEITL